MAPHSTTQGVEPTLSTVAQKHATKLSKVQGPEDTVDGLLRIGALLQDLRMEVGIAQETISDNQAQAQRLSRFADEVDSLVNRCNMSLLDMQAAFGDDHEIFGEETDLVDMTPEQMIERILYLYANRRVFAACAALRRVRALRCAMEEDCSRSRLDALFAAYPSMFRALRDEVKTFTIVWERIVYGELWETVKCRGTFKLQKPTIKTPGNAQILDEKPESTDSSPARSSSKDKQESDHSDRSAEHRFIEWRGEHYVHMPMESFLSVIHEPERWSGFMPFVSEARMIKIVGKGEYLVQIAFDFGNGVKRSTTVVAKVYDCMDPREEDAVVQPKGFVLHCETVTAFDDMIFSNEMIKVSSVKRAVVGGKMKKKVTGTKIHANLRAFDLLYMIDPDTHGCGMLSCVLQIDPRVESGTHSKVRAFLGNSIRKVIDGVATESKLVGMNKHYEHCQERDQKYWEWIKLRMTQTKLDVAAVGVEDETDTDDGLEISREESDPLTQSVMYAIKQIGEARYALVDDILKRLEIDLQSPEHRDSQDAANVRRILEEHKDLIEDTKERIKRMRAAEKDFYDVDERWTLAYETHGLKVHYRMNGPADNHNVLLRIESEIQCNLFHLLAVIYESDLWSRWLPFCTDSLTLENTSRTEQVAYQRLGMPFFPRDAIYSAFGVNMLEESGKLICLGRSVTQEDYPHLDFPKPKGFGASRMIYRDINLQVEPSGGDSCVGTLLVSVDPNIKTIPQSLIDFVIKRFAALIFFAMVKEARKVQECVEQGKSNIYLDRIADKDYFYKWARGYYDRFFQENAAGGTMGGHAVVQCKSVGGKIRRLRSTRSLGFTQSASLDTLESLDSITSLRSVSGGLGEKQTPTYRKRSVVGSIHGTTKQRQELSLETVMCVFDLGDGKSLDMDRFLTVFLALIPLLAVLTGYLDGVFQGKMFVTMISAVGLYLIGAARSGKSVELPIVVAMYVFSVLALSTIVDIIF
eukprot:Clim_evm12s20 gene=Clim_evmTU12s20